MHVMYFPFYSLLKRRLAKRLFVLLLVTLSGCNVAYAGETVTSEYKLKSVLLYKLTRFVEWPPLTRIRQASGAAARFRICLLGRDDFGASLDALENLKVENTPISVARYTRSEDVDTQCQILFISASKQPFMASIIKRMAPYPMLTVGDSEGFAEHGGMVQFVLHEKKIGFQINLDQVDHCKLKIAAPLLQMSTIVKGRQP